MPAIVVSPTIRTRLCAELRQIREATGKTGDTVAGDLRWSPSKISRYETGRTGISVREVTKLLDYYRITGDRRAGLLHLAAEASERGWWDDYPDLTLDQVYAIRMEHEATAVSAWDPGAVPVMLQIEEYAAALLAAHGRLVPVPPGARDRAARIFARRRAAHARTPATAVLGAAALARPYGGPAVLDAQLAHLDALAAAGAAAIYVLPDDAVPLVPAGPFLLYQFADAPAAVVTEYLRAPVLTEDDLAVYLTELLFKALADAALPWQSYWAARPAPRFTAARA